MVFITREESPARVTTFQAAIEGKESIKRIGTNCYSHVKQAEVKVAFQLHFGCDPWRLRSWVPVPWSETVKGILEHLVLKCPFISLRLLFLKCSLCIIHHRYYFCLDTSGIIPQWLKIIIPLSFLHRKKLMTPWIIIKASTSFNKQKARHSTDLLVIYFGYFNASFFILLSC